jgi:hypothetical protein
MEKRNGDNSPNFTAIFPTRKKSDSAIRNVKDPDQEDQFSIVIPEMSEKISIRR